MEPENDTERLIADSYANGAAVALRDGDVDLRVRGEFLSHLLISDGSARARSLFNVDGAHVVGKMSLAGRVVDEPVTLSHATFDVAPDFTGARIQGLRLTGSTCPGVIAPSLRVDGDLYFDGDPDATDGARFTATGPVDLEDAVVNGLFRMTYATLTPLFDQGDDVKDALKARRLRVANSLLMSHTCVEGGRIHLTSARIDGVFSLIGSKLRNSGGTTVMGERIEVAESLLAHGEFESTGRIYLGNAQVGGGIQMSGATLVGGFGKNGGRRTCVNLANAHIGRGVSLYGTTLRGSVVMARMRAGHNVNLRENDVPR